MKYQFSNVNRVAVVQFDFGIKPERLLAKLRKLPFEKQPHSLRSICKTEPRDSDLQLILELMHSKKFRLDILEHLYSLDHGLGDIYGQGGRRGLQWLWNGIDYEAMDNLLGYDVYFVRDAPGYTTELHIDRIGHPFVGIVYLNGTDPDFKTDFYDSRFKTNHFSVPHEYCKGWLQANHVNTWHEGQNRSKKHDRYSILFNWGICPP